MCCWCSGSVRQRLIGIILCFVQEFCDYVFVLSFRVLIRDCWLCSYKHKLLNGDIPSLISLLRVQIRTSHYCIWLFSNFNSLSLSLDFFCKYLVLNFFILHLFMITGIKIPLIQKIDFCFTIVNYWNKNFQCKTIWYMDF